MSPPASPTPLVILSSRHAVFTDVTNCVLPTLRPQLLESHSTTHRRRHGTCDLGKVRTAIYIQTWWGWGSQVWVQQLAFGEEVTEECESNL